MYSWLKFDKVPLYQSDQRVMLSHGHIEELWLGGLVNPYAYFTALKQEKAVLDQCHIDEVRIILPHTKTYYIYYEETCLSCLHYRRLKRWFES